MKKETSIFILKSIRVFAWLVTSFFALVGIFLFFGDFDNSIGAGMNFTIAMLVKAGIAVVCFILANLALNYADSITKSFKKLGIR